MQLRAQRPPRVEGCKIRALIGRKSSPLAIFGLAMPDPLMRRFRNPNEYVPRDASKYFFPEDLDDDVYADLLEEVPELAGKLKFNQNEVDENTMLPFIKKEVNGSFEIIPNDEEFDTERDEDPEEYPSLREYRMASESPKKYSSTERLLFFTRWPVNSSDEWAGRQNMTPGKFSWDPIDQAANNLRSDRVATCYWCGMNHKESIPSNSLCHDAFESPDWRARTLARYFRAHCHERVEYSEDIKSYYFSKYTTYRTDRGLIRRKYGPYFGGCFKRFLDVGKIYTQRGCRSWWPKYATKPNFVHHRFTRLEALIRKKKEYCLVSPQASLTPFSRSISLYVRYHVCVCEGRYCNDKIKLQYSLTLITLLIFIIVLMSF